MSKSLVIVESPAKGKTIKKYLGADYEVLASYGHVRDLVPKEGAVDPEADFSMKYQTIEDKEKHIQAIASGIQPLAAPLEKNPPRLVRRPCSEPGAAHDLRARG